MTTILLIRHGETEWNREEVFRGRIDVELNQTGTRQAELLAEYLSEVELAAVYSSPLSRALKTAEAIAARHNLRAMVAPELVDLDFGEWQGFSLERVKNSYPALYGEWTEVPYHVKFPNGESLDGVRARAIPLVDRVVAEHEGTVALVSHRVVNKVLICALLGLDNSHFWNIRMDTCGITSFAHENGRFILTRHNDASFLAHLGTKMLRDF